MSRRKTFLASVLSAGLAVALFFPADAQQSDRARGSDSQKPVVNTYDKRPDPRGDYQDLEAEPYQQNNVESQGDDVSQVEEQPAADEQKPVVDTYNKRPDPKGEAQKLDAVRYDQQNEANDGRAPELQMRVVEGAVDI